MKSADASPTVRTIASRFQYFVRCKAEAGDEITGLVALRRQMELAIGKLEQKTCVAEDVLELSVFRYLFPADEHAGLNKLISDVRKTASQAAAKAAPKGKAAPKASAASSSSAGKKGAVSSKDAAYKKALAMFGD